MRVERWPGQDFVAAGPLALDFGQVVVRSLRSPAKETPNEDSAAVFGLGGGRGVLAVADGVGGLPGGAQASATAVEALRAAIEEHVGAGQALREGILAGYERANRAVRALGTGGATTLAVLEVDGACVRAYNVGDSGALAFGGRGRVRLQTIFHSPVGYAMEAGLLDEEQAMVHEDRHLISNVVGDADMHVAMRAPVVLRPRDTVVLACDGLYDNLSTDEIVETLRRGPLAAAADALVAACRARMDGGGHADDLTVIALRPAPPPAARAAPGARP